MAHYDLIVRGGMVVDGSGLARRRIDVGIRGQRIARLGNLDEATADDEIDATGMVVAPGIVDIHTHYDPQITIDPWATVSCFHGVTTVLAGNCGFSVAPVKAEDRQALQDIFAEVENMDPATLAEIAWDDCETFERFVATREGRLGVNFATYVGHTNLRRWVMGEEASSRPATSDEVGRMCELARAAIQAGAAGISSSAAPTHLDVHGVPVPSRLADDDEMAALAAEVGRAGGGSIAYLPRSAIGGLDTADEDLLIRLARVSGLPVVIQGLGGRNKTDAPTATWDAARAFLDRATEAGAPVYSLLITRPFDRTIVLDATNLFYAAVPSWDRMLRLPRSEQLAVLRDPEVRAEMRTAVEGYNRDPAKGTTLPPPVWAFLYVDEVADPANAHLQSRSIREIADELGVAPADAMLDLALAEELETRFRWRAESEEWTAAVSEAQRDPRMIVGTSDGGAHLARDDGADWSSHFLRSWVLDRAVWTLEEGIRQITAVPAALVGLADRGRIVTGGWADLMVFDPETIGPWRKEFVRDDPERAGRFKAWGKGVKATIVNGTPIVLDEKLTGALPGLFVGPTRVEEVSR